MPRHNLDLFPELSHSVSEPTQMCTKLRISIFCHARYLQSALSSVWLVVCCLSCRPIKPPNWSRCERDERPIQRTVSVIHCNGVHQFGNESLWFIYIYLFRPKASSSPDMFEFTEIADICCIILCHIRGCLHVNKIQIKMNQTNALKKLKTTMCH